MPVRNMEKGLGLLSHLFDRVDLAPFQGLHALGLHPLNDEVLHITPRVFQLPEVGGKFIVLALTDKDVLLHESGQPVLAKVT